MLPPNPGSTPVGTVLMYAGATSGSSILNRHAAGWIICDGSTYPFTQFPDLYKVIGHTYGGNEEVFAVPSYQGLFLRGIDAMAGPGKEAGQPTAPRPDLPLSGNTGGSASPLQMDDFAAHMHAYGYYNKYRESIHSLSHKSLSGSQQNEFNSPADNATRPVHQYVNYIIKAVASPGAVPVGAVVPYSGDIKNEGNFRAAGWLPCIGTNLKIRDYTNLFQAISNFYGAEDEHSFRLPDFRGQFIRGVQGEVPSTDNSNALNETRPNNINVNYLIKC
ncbi:phage tail protein [Chitinophaga sancti]|uniref:phage tail protein n=1 Tax=Chitinophaga sancti TaxID=1004 RepID=UPI003F7ACC40